MTKSNDEQEQSFYNAEMTGRELFKEFMLGQKDVVKRLQFAKYPMARYDGYFYSGYTMGLFEIKNRNVQSNFYPSIRIEKNKYDFLTQRVKTEMGLKLEVEPFYISIYTDNVIALVNLNQINPKWTWKWCPKESMSQSKTWVKKLVYDIPNDAALKYSIS